MRWRDAFLIIGVIVALTLDFDIARADPAAAISPSEVATIFKRLTEAGGTRSMPSKITEPLGLSKGGEILFMQELVFEHDEYQHGFYKTLKQGDDRIILVIRTPEKYWMAFLTNSRFKLITAVQWQAGQNPAKSDFAEALPLFENEVAYWAALAEIL